MSRIAILSLCLAGFILAGSAPAAQEDDKGYFLSFPQKGQLIWTGLIRDSKGNWYDVRIVPGYVSPTKYGWRNIKQAGQNLSDYGSGSRYGEMLDTSGDCLQWGFEDCLWDFGLKGSAKAWGRNFGAANARVERRVFGWWMAYPWAVMQSVVEDVVRLPLGVVGAALGTGAGVAVVPAYCVAEPAVKAVWNGPVTGVALPVAGMAWNTVIAPPMALVGQKPAESRVDGFWVRMHSEKPVMIEPSKADVSEAVAWGDLLLRELAPFEAKEAAIETERHARMDELRRKMNEAGESYRTNLATVRKEKQNHIQALAASNTVSASQWSRDDVYRNSAKITKALRERGVSDRDAETIVRLLSQFPPGRPPRSPGPVIKTDPVLESIEVIKQIE